MLINYLVKGRQKYTTVNGKITIIELNLAPKLVRSLSAVKKW